MPPLVTPEERLTALRRFQTGSKPLGRGVAHPLIVDLPALVTPAPAREMLLEAIVEHDRFLESSPEARPVDPIFGPLDREERSRFHEKHRTHHLQQLGLP